MKLALRPWRLALMSQLISASAVGILLLLSGLLFWMQQGLSPVIAHLQGEEVITAYIDPAVQINGEVQVAQQIQDEIHQSLGAASTSAEVQIKAVSADDFSNHLKEHYPDLYKELEDLSVEAPGIVPRYISISGVLPEGTLQKIKAISGIESVESSKNRYRHSIGVVMALKKVAGFLSLGLIAALLTGMVHLARSNALLHQESLKLLKLWGANDWTLRAPGILSATSVGLLGGLVAFEGWAFSVTWLSQTIRTLSPLLETIPHPSIWSGILLVLIGALFGFIAGALGRILPDSPSYSRSRS